ncbi:MAG: allophanate hydrolase, partial [Acinetobacter junii]
GDQIYSAQLKTYPVELNHFVQTKPKVGDEIIIDVYLGPRTDWFSTDSLELFFNQRWQVSAESNRIGLRLSGEKPLVREIDKELPSEGCCTGAIQVPPNGQPVLFMNDHPITGGYPVIASVAAYHLDLIAQIPTGCFIQFRQISDFMDLK